MFLFMLLGTYALLEFNSISSAKCWIWSQKRHRLLFLKVEFKYQISQWSKKKVSLLIQFFEIKVILLKYVNEL